MKNLKFQFGQSLVEVVFAIGIMLLVVAAVLALTTSNIVGQKESEFQIVANNLAREGIEVVRNIRDSNWLARRAWDTGISGSSAIAIFDEAENSWQLKFTYTENEKSLYFSASRVFSHIVSGEKTVYERELILDNICLNTDGQDYIQIQADCDTGDQKIGIKVSSIVEWADMGGTRRVTLEDLLYEWK